MASSHISTKKLSEENVKLNGYLNELDQRIYSLEQLYLTSTPYGNVSRGFDGYLDHKAMVDSQSIQDSDRIFSFSSYKYWSERKGRIIHTNGLEDMPTDDFSMNP